MQFVYKWCGAAVERLQSYVRVLENYNKGEAREYVRTIIPLLEEGIRNIVSAQKLSQQRNEIIKLGSLKVQAEVNLDTIKALHDFDERIAIREIILKNAIELIVACKNY